MVAEVLRSDFALSQKDNKIIAVSKMSNGQVKLYRCASDQRSCSIDHKSALTISRRKSRVEKIIVGSLCKYGNGVHFALNVSVERES